MQPSMLLNQRSPKSSPPAPPSPSERLKSRFTALGVVTPLASVVLRLLVPGWMILLFGIPLLFAAIIHLIVHVRAASHLATRPGAPSWLFVLSNALCFLGFGLEPDFGDAPSFCFGFARVWNLLAQSGSSNGTSSIDMSLYNVAFYASLVCLLGMVVTWIVIGVRSRPPKQEGAIEPT